MTDLGDLVESLKRAVAPPGEFASAYVSATDSDVADALMDGFAETQLDGFFVSGYDADLTAGTVTPDLTLGQQRLIVIYAAATLVQSRLLNLRNRVKYAAGTASYETEQGVSLLTTLLKQLNDRKNELRLTGSQQGAGAAFSMADGYWLNAVRTYGNSTYSPFGGG